MTIRRGILTCAALALVAAGCAGTDEGSAALDPGAAVADDGSDTETTEDDGDDHDDDAMADDHDDDAMADDDHGDDTMADDHDDDAMADDHDDDAMAGDEDVDRVVEIAMEDIAFSVTELEFTVGERVLFVFENVGAAPHEALIGDMHVQDEHEEQMAEGGGHHDDAGHHGDLSMISLESGESGSFVHEFTEAGELWMGCHVPGHWGAGMRTVITVTS